MQVNICIRCGKERITSKVWTEMVGRALITNTQTICPDSACQKIVDEELTARREKSELLASRKKPAGNKQVIKS